MSYRAEIDRLLASPPPDWKRQWRNARVQLRALGYKAPALPDASKALMALSLTAGGRRSGDRVVGTVPVPAAVRDEAMRAVRMSHRHDYGAWNFIGLARAIQLATIPRIDTRSVERMRGFFTRHAKDAEAAGFGDDAHPSRGYLAHLVWGGDPAKEWVMGMEQRGRRNPTVRADTDTPAFRRWFGESKVVDKHGRPRVMYHGTSEDFSVFDTSGTRRSKQIGAMFTPSRAYAANYGRKDTGGRVLACYLRIERPFDSKNKQHNREWETNRLGLEGWTEYARRVGYDGAITMLNEYVVFDPSQIKSVDNRGTFDPADPDIRHNPARVRRNPLAQPSPTMAFSFRKDAIPGVVEVYLYEPEELDDPARSLVGGAMLTLAAGGRWETQGMAACPGYGPLVYDLAASVLQARIHATGDQTEAAKRFWARQGKRYIDPMKPEAFAKKYGVTPKELFVRGYELTPDDYRRMGDELSTVFWGAKEAEKKGKPLALLRCAVPNGRRRR